MKYSFFIIALTIFLALIFYALLRGCQVLREIYALKNMYLTSGILLFVILIAAFLTNFFTFPGQRAVALIGYTGLIIFLYLILSFFIVDLIRVVNYIFHFTENNLFVFRKIIFFITLLFIAIILVIGNYKFEHPAVRHLPITLSNKSLKREPTKIVMASDLHLGITVNQPRLERFVSLINAQEPDIVLFVGDIFDGNILPVVQQNMYEVLQQIKAPLGIFAVLGNHEYIGGQTEQKINYLEKSNVVVLRDSVILVDSLLYLIGRDDRTNPHRKSLELLTRDLDQKFPIILLDHQPYNLSESEQNGVDLHLSGHTHDGQFFPITLIVKSMYEKAHGYLQKNHTHYYISSGLGLWGAPYRINSESELVVIELK